MIFKKLESVKNHPKIPKMFKYNPFIKYAEIIFKNEEYFGHIYINGYGDVESFNIYLKDEISKAEFDLIKTQIEKIYSSQCDYPYLIIVSDDKFDTSNFEYIDRIVSLKYENETCEETEVINCIAISKEVPDNLTGFFKKCYNYDNYYNYSNFDEQAEEYGEDQKSEFISFYNNNKEYIGLLILEKKESEIIIEHLCVVPSERRKGIAEKLLRTVFQKFGKKPIILDVYELNYQAYKLYEKLGFQEDKTGEKYIITKGIKFI
ncbi:MAG: GNAT family N-acetyltransferase [Candidatus Cloacimonetes bacterium]|nr:GNAT family N-acetyltransferase [Candidatus Cloacimonadota bacterium]